jgi:hypothetical protein
MKDGSANKNMVGIGDIEIIKEDNHKVNQERENKLGNHLTSRNTNSIGSRHN